MSVCVLERARVRIMLMIWVPKDVVASRSNGHLRGEIDIIYMHTQAVTMLMQCTIISKFDESWSNNNSYWFLAVAHAFREIKGCSNRNKFGAIKKHRTFYSFIQTILTDTNQKK